MPSLAAILTLTALAASAAGKPHVDEVACAQPRTGGPGDVVRALYAAFPWDGRKAIQHEPADVLSRYFDSTLGGLFVKDQECARAQGLCRITADVLYRAQDADIDGLRICASRRGAEWIDVRFKNFGTDVLISYRVVMTKAGWRIADLEYDDGSSLVAALSKPF